MCLTSFLGIAYYRSNDDRFFLSFEAKYPNPEFSKGKKGCFAVADFWKEVCECFSKRECFIKIIVIYTSGASVKDQSVVTNEYNFAFKVSFNQIGGFLVELCKGL
jgi:hypothetical protein